MKQLELFKWEHVVHGTVYMYKQRGCRCDDCRRAANEYRLIHNSRKCTRCGCPTMSAKADAVCHTCRKAAPRSTRDRQSFPCAQCGAEAGNYRRTWAGYWKWYRRKFCSDRCRRAAHPTSDYVKPYYRRSEIVPGLRASGRAKLLAKWRRQGRVCFYCDGPADSVDHVVPLVRGGTNFEGNLVPCCLTCNGSKGGSLLMEWRLRRGALKAAA